MTPFNFRRARSLTADQFNTDLAGVINVIGRRYILRHFKQGCIPAFPCDDRRHNVYLSRQFARHRPQTNGKMHAFCPFRLIIPETADPQLTLSLRVHHDQTVLQELIDCGVGPHIRPEGWHDWGKPAFHEKGFYAEYPAPALPRAPFARTLTDEEAGQYTYENFITSL